jgi:hypothetical protein
MAKTLLSLRICGTGRWQKSGSNRAAQTFRASRSIASRISTLRIIGRYVYHLRARLMPTRPPMRRYVSKAFCAAIMICCQIDRTEPRRSDLDVCTLVVRR